MSLAVPPPADLRVALEPQLAQSCWRMNLNLLKWVVTCVFGAAAITSGLTAENGSAAGSFRYRIGFSTLLGGSEYDDVREIILLPDDSLFLGGQTVSPDFPVTEGVVQPHYGGEPAGTGHP